MPLAIPFIAPRVTGIPGIDSPVPRAFFPQWTAGGQATFREADFVVTNAALTGGAAGVFPFPQGSMAALPGPVTSAITFGQGAVAGAPAATYYIVVAYSAATNESLISQEYVINSLAGFVPTVNVAAAGAPGAATNFVVFTSHYSGGETLQQASLTTTALGATFTHANPLINASGIVRAATSSSTLIVGISAQDSQAIWATGVGGSQTGGNIANLLGAWANPSPLGLPDPQELLVDSLLNFAPFEISFTQPWSNGYIGSQAGLRLDVAQQAAGIFVADTTSTACMVIKGLAGGAESDVGGQVGDTGVRILAYLLASAAA